MSEVKLYAERDIEALDEAGSYCYKHIFAMTGENLRSKSDIAAELGHRDLLIDQLKSEALGFAASVRDNADEDFLVAAAETLIETITAYQEGK